MLRWPTQLAKGRSQRAKGRSERALLARTAELLVVLLGSLLSSGMFVVDRRGQRAPSPAPSGSSQSSGGSQSSFLRGRGRGRRSRSSSVSISIPTGGRRSRSSSRARSSSADSWGTQSNSGSNWSDESSVWAAGNGVTITRSRSRSSSVDRSHGIGRRRDRKAAPARTNSHKKDQIFTVTLVSQMADMAIGTSGGSGGGGVGSSSASSTRRRPKKQRQKQKNKQKRGQRQRRALSQSGAGSSSTMFTDERLSELANLGLVRDDGTEARAMLVACHDDKDLAMRRLALGDDPAASVQGAPDGGGLLDAEQQQPLVEMEILVDGTPLATRTAQAECCRAHMCGGDDHRWTYALIKAGDESKPFTVRVRNHTAQQLAVELTVDNETMARAWGVGPHKTKVRQGQNTRYFACHTFQFDVARFVTLGGNPIKKEAEDLATIDEEGEDDEEDADAMDEDDGDEAAAAPAAAPAAAAAGGGAAGAAGGVASATIVANRVTATQFDAGFVHDVDGGQETAKQMDTPGLNALKDTEKFEKFQVALPGAYVRARCYVAEWNNRRGAPAGGRNNQQQGGGDGAPAPPAILSTRATAAIAVSTGYGQELPIPAPGNGGGKLIRRGELPLAELQLVYRREADVPAAPVAPAE